MNILSDDQIRERLERSELVVGGVPQDAVGCSYSFKPGKIFPAGSTAQPLDWDAAGAARGDYIAKPGEMFWIRTHRKVALPDDICAFWWQTNKLSREGIMLVNMSMVDPGYHGWLACLFVNFGSQNVVIRPDTTVARLIFAQLSRPCSHPFKETQELGDYDGRLREGALRAASSFLQVNEQAATVAAKLDGFEASVDRMGEQLKDEAVRLSQTLSGDLERAVHHETEDLRRNLIEALKKLLWPYVAWVVLAAAVWEAMNLAGDRLRPVREEQLRRQVEEYSRKADEEFIRRAVQEALQARSAAPAGAPAPAVLPGSNRVPSP